MRRLGTMWIDMSGALFSLIVFKVVEYPDSLFACLSAVFAVQVITGMLSMCDRLLDPPPAIFLLFTVRENDFSQFLHMP